MTKTKTAPKNAHAALTAAGLDVRKRDMLTADPDDLEIITDPTSNLWDPSVEIPLPEWFVEKVRRDGVTDPIKVKRDGARMIVVDGRQRTKAARLLKAEGHAIRVPFLVIHGTDMDMVLTSLGSNGPRVNTSEMSIAAKVLKAHKLGASNADIALQLGYTGPSGELVVQDYLELVSMPARVQDAVERGLAPRTMIRELAAMGSEKALEAVAGFETLSAERVAQGMSPKLYRSEASKAVSAVREGRKVDPSELPTRRKMRGRSDLEAFLEVSKGDDREGVVYARALALWVLGHEHGFTGSKPLRTLLRKATGEADPG